jgi:hypothetical protein
VGLKGRVENHFLWSDAMNDADGAADANDEERFHFDSNSQNFSCQKRKHELNFDWLQDFKKKTTKFAKGSLICYLSSVI